ncbi:MAG: hypothetical protein LBH37_04700 [Oscillospiraceae bacterium]|jgi:arginyl-tRNA synthetase|nr:hypothetical protein [Oscillospiraceae bacterium]
MASERVETEDSQSKKPFLIYKNNPLVRCKDVIYYGDMSNDYVVKLRIKSKKRVKNIEIADKVSVQLMSTDPGVDDMERIVKKSEKRGLYLALDIADAWLSKALAAV